MCAKIRVWSCLVTDNFGLFTEIAVCKFLRGWRLIGPKSFLFCPLYVFRHFSAAFCTAHCALESCLGSCAIEMSIIIIMINGQSRNSTSKIAIKPTRHFLNKILTYKNYILVNLANI